MTGGIALLFLAALWASSPTSSSEVLAAGVNGRAYSIGTGVRQLGNAALKMLLPPTPTPTPTKTPTPTPSPIPIPYTYYGFGASMLGGLVELPFKLYAGQTLDGYFTSGGYHFLDN